MKGRDVPSFMPGPLIRGIMSACNYELGSYKVFEIKLYSTPKVHRIQSIQVQGFWSKEVHHPRTQGM